MGELPRAKKPEGGGRCLFCGGASWAARLELPGPAQPARVFACRRCGAERAELSGEARRLYGAGYYVFADAALPRQERRARLLLAEARRVRPPAGRLFDAGAARGHFLAAARQAGYAVAGRELAPEAARWGRERLGLAELRPGAIEELGAADGRHDLVTAFEVLEHLPDPGGALGRLRGLLAPGGRLLLSVPNAGSWFKAWLGNNWPGYNAFHLHYFRPRDLGRLLAAAGFASRRTWSRTFETGPLVDALFAAGRAPGRPGAGYRLAARILKYALVLPAARLADRQGGGETLFAEAAA